jgi:flagellin-like protein
MNIKSIRLDNKGVSPIVAIILMVAITVVLASVLYLWIENLIEEPNPPESIHAELEQGDGNLTEGCLFTLTKGSGDSVKIKDYTIRVGKEGRSLIPLRWPKDGNSSYTIDSGMKSNDEDFWDATETMGFDAPSWLTGIHNGDSIEVIIKNEATGDIVFKRTFIYNE